MTKLVLIHGWGMSASIFDNIRVELGDAVLTWELPGHGKQSWSKTDELGLDSWVDRLLKDLPDEPVDLMGWSLGGTVALAALERSPERINRVLLCVATPHFTQDGDWSGTSAQDLQQFQLGLETAPLKTMLRFMALQTKGLANARELLGYLKQAIVESHVNWTALSVGLNILATADLRETVKVHSNRINALLGEKDFLVPSTIRHDLSNYGVDVKVIPHCAHTPFLSHPREFIELIQLKHHALT